MLYDNLARSFDDLAPLEALIGKLENSAESAQGIASEPFLNQLFEHIRIGAMKNSRIFCAHTDVYINHLVINANHLLIYMHEVNRQMEDRMYLKSNEICMVNNFSMLASMLQELVVSFESLASRQH